METSAVFAFGSAVFVVGWVCLGLRMARRRAGDADSFAIWLFAAAWLAVPSAVAASGVLADFSATPPRMMLVLPMILAASLAFVYSGWGRALRDHCSMAALIGFQSFRLLPETLLALAYQEGLAPIQMTVEGRNWDILSAVLAAAVYWRWRQAPGAFHAGLRSASRWQALGCWRIFSPSPCSPCPCRFGSS